MVRALRLVVPALQRNAKHRFQRGCGAPCFSPVLAAAAPSLFRMLWATCSWPVRS